MFFMVDISQGQPNQTQIVESEETIILSHKSSISNSNNAKLLN
ncbi:hypothetical protein MGWOODY_XGa2263 [hydrothermal vent metagenome]|uniref:Uncharacterized protein n=1 Tax=hydrothermal vent metagenome TaxID=652676 RepID=A0A170PQM5_9ZZZZ